MSSHIGAGEKKELIECRTHNERLVFLDDILGEEGWNGIERNEGAFYLLPARDSPDVIARRLAFRRTSFRVARRR